MTPRNVRGAYYVPTHDRPQDWDWLAKWQPGVIHLMVHGSHTEPNSVSVPLIRRVHETCPDATILLRVWDVDDRNFEAHAAMVSDAIAEANKQVEWWARVFDNASRGGVPRDRLMAGLNNETGPEKDGPLYMYSHRALIRATQLDVRLGVFVFSAGRPALPGEAEYTIDTFAQLDGAILANRGAVVLNEYMQPEGMYAVWTDDQGKERKDYTYLIGRHNRWNIKSPIIIGEWGVEGILYNRHRDPKWGNSGWRNFKDLWPPNRYADEYVECVRQASDNVIGICPFLSDWADHRWQSFDLIDAYGEFVARKDLCVKEIADKHETPPPIIAPGPTPPQPQEPTRVPPLTHPIADPALRVASQVFGVNPDRYAKFGMAGHNGVDFAVPGGTPIGAVAQGQVVESQLDAVGYGEYVKLRHAWGESLYAHLKTRKVDPGDSINAGQVVGTSGNTGNSTGPHLHFGLRVNPYKRGWPFDGYSDPLPYLEGKTQPVNVLAAIKGAANDSGVEWQLLASLAWAESSFNPKAKSGAGAMGLFQIMPATWAEWAPSLRVFDAFDADDNATVGAAYYAWLLKTLGNEWSALAAYNFGIGNVLNQVKPPDETVEFINKVIFGRDLLKAVGV